MFYEGKTLKEARKDVDSFWSYLYQKKEDADWLTFGADKIRVDDSNIDNYIFDASTADPNILNQYLTDLNNVDKAVKTGAMSWQDYSNKLDDNCKWIAQWGQETEGQIRTTEGLVQANQNARQAAIAHNAALKQQTLGAKAAKFALSALATVGNMLLVTAIMEGVSWLLTYNKRLEEARQEIIELGQETAKTSESVYDLVDQYRKLGEDGTIDASDQEKARSIQEQLTELVGDQAANLDLVNGKYDTQIEKLRQIQNLQAVGSKADLWDAQKAAEDSLKSMVSSLGFGDNSVVGLGALSLNKEREALSKLLKDEGYVKYGLFDITGDIATGFDIANGDSSPEEIIKAYEDMVQLREILVASYSNEISEGGALEDFYNNLTKRCEELKDGVTKYQEALDAYELNEAVQIFNNATDASGTKRADALELTTGALIENEEQMVSWANQMLASDQISEGVKNQLIGLAKTNYPDLSSAIDSVTNAYLANKLATLDSQTATSELIIKLFDLASQCGMTEQAFHELVLDVGIFNNNNLTIDDKISALQMLGYTAQWAGKQVANIQKVGASENGTGKDLIAAYDENGRLVGAEFIKELNVDTSSAPTYSDIKSSGDPSSSTGSKPSSSSDADKAEKEALEKFKEGLETREKLLERYKKAVDLTDFGLDIAEENDFALRADLLNNKMSQLTSYGLAMREEFDRVASIIPKTGEEAEALGSHLESLGSDMRDNIKNLRETRVAMEQLKIDSIVSIGDYYLGDLENELSSIEKRIEILNKDNKEDYKYTNQILQMEMFLPTASSTIGAQNKRRNADQDIIASEQATQDTLNDMFETQIKLNDKLREDERQALLEDMETMRQDMVLKLESANKDYDSSWQTAQATTDTGISNIENALNNMNMTIPAPDISAVVTACEQVKEMLDHMGDADYTPPKLRISDGINGGDANSIISGNKPNIVSNVAKNQLGVPYVWGGIAPGEGLDCSGLTQYAYGVAGVSLPRRSQEQWSCGTGTRIDWENLKKGDQLFFGSNGEATHTGIYVGNGQMIHAPHTGDVVKYSSIETEYYQGMFLGAKRYAVGTPNGNAQARRFGIAGENFKPEILIDKITGETKYIDKPTLIDITKTDVVGEKATAKMPKFATGTPMANEKYLKEIKEACEAFDVPYNIALSLIDQESANGTESDTWRKNSAGAVGLTQITASALGDFRETQHQVTRDILAKLSENNVNFENSRTESESAYRDNIWTGIANLRLLNDRYFNGDDSTWKKTLGWYYAGGAYNGSKGQWYANQVTNRANSQPFVDVAKALGDNTIALENNTSAIEETDPNKLKVKEIQEYVNGVAGDIDESVSSTRVQQIQILNDDSLSDREKTFELFNIYEPAADKATEIGYEAWNSLYNKFMDWWQKTETGEEDFVQETFDSYIDGLDKIKETVTDVEENVVGLKETIVGYMEDNLTEIDEYIEKHNFYNDWDIIGDTEADAIERQMDIIRKYYDEGIISAEEYFKRIEDLTQEHIEAEKRFYDSFFNDIESEISKTYDIRISRLNSHSSLLSTHFNLVNAISEEQHNLNKELIEAETVGARMNEQERETLFTKQEHANLSSKLNDILSDAKNIQASYTAELANATSDTIEEITNNYERQYELKMKEYEVVKAELSLAKAQQQLENVKNEKSVRTWTGSSWGYDSNLQDVLEAESAAEDARYEVLKAKTAENQEIALNAIDAEADALQTEKNKFSSALEEISNGMDTSGRNINSWLKTIAETDLPMFDEIVRTMGDSIKKAFDISDEDFSSIRDDAQHYSDTIAEMQANSEEWHTATPERRQELRDENTRLAGLLGLDWDKKSSRWKKANGNYAYEVSDSIIIEKMKANSEEWHTATPERRQELRDENTRLAGLLGLDWDKKSSRWKKANGNYAYEVSDSIIIEKMKANSEEWHTATPERRQELRDENTRLAGLLGLDWDDSTGRWKKPDGTYAYANGTKNAHKGLGLYDEEGLGSELILRDGVLTQFQGGERVFSPEMADRLWEMAQQNYNFAPTIVQPDFGRLIPIEDKISNAFSNISNAFGDTYMIKDVQLNESEGGTLKGFMNFLKKYT